MRSFSIFRIMRYKKIVTLSLLFALSACVYEPEQFVASDSVSSSSRDASEIGTLYPVNLNIPKGCKQICNPSVSQDTVNYPASMLWLNFSGTRYRRGGLSFPGSGMEYASWFYRCAAGLQFQGRKGLQGKRSGLRHVRGPHVRQEKVFLLRQGY